LIGPDCLTWHWTMFHISFIRNYPVLTEQNEWIIFIIFNQTFFTLQTNKCMYFDWLTVLCKIYNLHFVTITSLWNSRHIKFLNILYLFITKYKERRSSHKLVSILLQSWHFQTVSSMSFLVTIDISLFSGHHLFTYIIRSKYIVIINAAGL
jgi:hypothetical protein